MMTPANPIVDVIIPVYNQCQLTVDCLASVLAARNETQFEVVVVDDASTDVELQERLSQLARECGITLLRNNENAGFTRSVNRGMRLHPDRDVLLLNNDTLVFGDWIDRLRSAAYSASNIASVNPLTNSSHISSYPFHGVKYDGAFEIDDKTLDSLAAKVNDGRTSVVHTTVGFCMYIRQAALDDVGYFDGHYFPYAYGEESDFCYRARKVGWRHLVTGDVFVRHLEGRSFGERRARLVAEAVKVFIELHPEYEGLDRKFSQTDPNSPLRINLHFARLKLMLGDVPELLCITDEELHDGTYPGPVLLSRADGTVRILGSMLETFPHLPIYTLPADIASFNTMLERLGIARLRFRERSTKDTFAAMMRGRAMDIGVAAELVVRDPDTLCREGNTGKGTT
jgi:GT2 family glycosyltransferase